MTSSDSTLPRTAVRAGITDPVESARAELKAAWDVAKKALHAAQDALEDCTDAAPAAPAAPAPLVP